MSDGLVRIENAAVRGAPRAFVHRSHSGNRGIVNSEEGYQNLVRFLFGSNRVDGYIEVEKLPLPKAAREAYDEGTPIKGSYYFESTVAPRGAMTYVLSQRSKGTFSAVLRKFDELMRVEEPNKARSPRMFTAFLDKSKIPDQKADDPNPAALVFSIDVAVSSTEFEIDGFLFFNDTIPGEYLFRDNIVIRISKGDDGLQVHYIFSDEDWGEPGADDEPGHPIEKDDNGDMYIPLQRARVSRRSFASRLPTGITGRREPGPLAVIPELTHAIANHQRFLPAV